MSERPDPLDEIQVPTLAEQIAPYRKYGDTELALALLHFQKQEGIGVPALTDGSSMSRFCVNSQPANAGATFYCEECEENVRQVSRPDNLVFCPLCRQRPGMDTLGRGVR